MAIDIALRGCYCDLAHGGAVYGTENTKKESLSIAYNSALEGRKYRAGLLELLLRREGLRSFSAMVALSFGLLCLILVLVYGEVTGHRLAFPLMLVASVGGYWVTDRLRGGSALRAEIKAYKAAADLGDGGLPRLPEEQKFLDGPWGRAHRMVDMMRRYHQAYRDMLIRYLVPFFVGPDGEAALKGCDDAGRELVRMEAAVLACWAHDDVDGLAALDLDDWCVRIVTLTICWKPPDEQSA